MDLTMSISCKTLQLLSMTWPLSHHLCSKLIRPSFCFTFLRFHSYHASEGYSMEDQNREARDTLNRNPLPWWPTTSSPEYQFFLGVLMLLNAQLFFFFGHSCGVWEFPGPGIEPQSQQYPEPQQWQHWIFNLLSYHRTRFNAHLGGGIYCPIHLCLSNLFLDSGLLEPVPMSSHSLARS